MSLRKAINQSCKDCAYDVIAAGTWRQQVTLCGLGSCAFYDVRPKTTSAIPKSVLSYYGVEMPPYQAQNSDDD